MGGSLQGDNENLTGSCDGNKIDREVREVETENPRSYINCITMKDRCTVSLSMLTLPSLLWQPGGSASPAGMVLGCVLHLRGLPFGEGCPRHTRLCCQGAKETSTVREQGKRSLLLYCLLQLPPKHHSVSGSLVL